MALHRAGAEWRTSSYSGANGDCVEVATTMAGAVAVRDSKDRGGPALHFSPADWHAFVEVVREGGPGTR